MATYTPNLNLYMPDASDDFGDFRAEFNNNMVKLDNGGGGGSGGHTIIDENGTSMPQRAGLQFDGATVTDDSVNDKTVVSIVGGGGDTVLGAFIDPNKSLTSSVAFSNSTPISYTATEDCIVEIYNDSANGLEYCVDGLAVYYVGSGSYTLPLPLKKGQTLTSVSANSYSGAYHAYGLTHGTHAIGLGECYSTTEKEVGCWTDGKPLYQITYDFSNSPISVSTGYSAVGNIDSSNLEMIVGIIGQHSDGTFWDDFSADPTLNSHTKLGIRATTSHTVSYLTIQYTKISDTAGSGTWTPEGSYAVHYDGTEKVIGTWFGKPLYQKTVDFGALPNNNIKDLNHGITIADKIWVAGGFAYQPNGDFSNQLNLSGVSSGEWYFGVNSTFIRCSTQSDRTNYSAFVTLNYTKTTD